MEDELINNTCEEFVNETIMSIKKVYSVKYTPQVNPREINLFYLKNNSLIRFFHKRGKSISF